MTRANRYQLVLALAGKDWRLFWADRRAAVLAFAVPVLLASAFGMIFHRPAQSESAKLPVAVVVEGDDAFSRRVVADLLASPRLDARVMSRAEAEAKVASRRPAVAVVLPRDFGTAASGGTPRVEILHHPTTAVERQWAEGVLTEAVMKRVAGDKLGPLADKLAPPFAVDAVTPQTHAAFNAYSHSFCGMTLQYLLFWGMESGLVFLRERNRGTWARVRAAPVPLWAALAGKTVSTAWIALLQVLVTFVFGYVAFGVVVGGSWAGFVLLAVAASLLAASTGLLVAAVGGTESRARSVSILVILSVSMVGGLWLPAFLLPAWVSDIAVSLPTTWAMNGLEAVTWQGRGLAAAAPAAGVVAAFAVAFTALAAWRLSAAEARIRRGQA
ncbi:MAG TPA: ABC transporter permease [Gemmata sp.]|nr:ABC transporter permease [Gemmata sp.]